MTKSRVALIVMLALILPASDTVGFSEEIDFSRDVRPILSKFCFKCHGMDDAQRQASLRLDEFEGATIPADSGKPAIIPGRPAQSELVRRINSNDTGDQMPPPETKKTLSPEQRRTLADWIQNGAKYQRHWAFIAPRKTAPQRIKSNWPRNPIDRFILAQMKQRGLAPAEEADRYTLVRRLYLDLVGFPPTVAETDRFVNDRSPNAYEELVDRLLGSNHYGERWARQWLDLARYADTNGYEKDRPRTMWPFRDWVIDAINRDMPFDQFTVEQIAGDMLPHPKTSQLIATGFHRNTMINEEGGIDPLEFRFYSMTDRVFTTSTVWLGLTMGCAQCHTHKYDPITQKEYYQFMAYLNNADEPEMEVVDQSQLMRYSSNLAKANELIKRLPQKWPLPKGVAPSSADGELIRTDLVREAFAKWKAAISKSLATWQPIRPTKMKTNLPLLTHEPDNTIFASGDTTKFDTYWLTLDLIEYEKTHGPITAIRLEALPDERLPARGPGMTWYEGTKGDFFLNEFRLTGASGSPIKFATATHSFAKNRFGNNPATAALAIDGDYETGWSVHGRQGERHVAVFNLASPLKPTSPLTLTMTFGRHFGSSLGRFRLSATSDKTGLTASDIPMDVEIAVKRESVATKKQQKQAFEYFLLHAPQLKDHAQEIEKLRKRPVFERTLIFTERPSNNPRPTFVHERGEYLRPADRVAAGIPRVLDPEGSSSPQNRLQFARWLVSDKNPLSARVTVNRDWAAIFGTGIVKTTEDFGTQGALPTHPALLDWLAVTFMENGWSRKKLHRLIVTSATYRQSARVSVLASRIDPGNRYLSHMPRVRLDAELIRDSVLRISGLLSTKLKGPSVFPPQPKSITTEGTYGRLNWQVSQGEDRYRRGLYTFAKRTAPFAMFMTFDGSSGEACIPRRERSNTPLQALTLLNDVVFLEAAIHLGQSIAQLDAESHTKATTLFRRCLTRPPSPRELGLIVRFFGRTVDRIKSGKVDIKQFAKGLSPEQAAWALAARSLLNLDETITKE